jgi:hypothetical protein
MTRLTGESPQSYYRYLVPELHGSIYKEMITILSSKPLANEEDEINVNIVYDTYTCVYTLVQYI